MDTFCVQCREELVELKNAESSGIILFTTPEQVRASAGAGCQACAMFETNLSLFEGWEGFFDDYAKQYVKDLSESVRRGPIILISVLFNEMGLGFQWIGLLPATPMAVVLRLSSDVEHLLPPEDYALEPSTGSDASFVQARKWIDDCIQNHEHCRLSSAASSGFRPKRLLKLGSTADSVRLCEAAEASSAAPWTAPYATLSHCWGGSVPFQLTAGNHVHLLENDISTQELGLTFQDAVEIASKLGVGYLWIDSLCILQDSADDWMEQSVQMQQIYSSSYCNIAATSAADSSEGCFRARKADALRPIKLLSIPESTGSDNDDGVAQVYLTDAGLWWERFEREPLNRRAWVLQERILAPRVLHYDRDQIAWECNELVATERFPKGLGHLIGNNNIYQLLRTSLDKELRVDQEASVPGRALAEIWRPVVRQYTTLNITRWSDHLIALAGVGRRIQGLMGWGYVAGLFDVNMASQLTWRVMEQNAKTQLCVPDRRHKGVKRPAPRLAPTWSWLSLDGRINFLPHWEIVKFSETALHMDAVKRLTERWMTPEDLKEQPLCRVREISRPSTTEETVGIRSTATLRLSGFLIPIVIRKAAEIAEWQTNKKSKDRTIAGESECMPWPVRTGVLGDVVAQTEPAGSNSDNAIDDTTEQPQLDFEAFLEWDVFEECNPHEELYLMPAIEVLDHYKQDIFEMGTYRSAHGLLLARAADGGRNDRFERRGFFKLPSTVRPSVRFWRAASMMKPIPGVQLLAEDGVPWPEFVPTGTSSGDVEKHAGMQQQDGKLQYRFQLV